MISGIVLKDIVERWYGDSGIAYKKQLNLFHGHIIDLRI